MNRQRAVNCINVFFSFHYSSAKIIKPTSSYRNEPQRRRLLRKTILMPLNAARARGRRHITGSTRHIYTRNGEKPLRATAQKLMDIICATIALPPRSCRICISKNVSVSPSLEFHSLTRYPAPCFSRFFLAHRPPIIMPYERSACVCEAKFRVPTFVGWRGHVWAGAFSALRIVAGRISKNATRKF